MRRWKSALLKCLPVLSGELFAFLTLDILWTLLEYGPPFSLPLYLAAGAAVVLVNDRFLRRRRTVRAILLVNAGLCLAWGIPLALTLERSHPVLLMFQLPLFALPPLLGWRSAVTPVTPQKMQGCSEMTGLFTLFYLIVASFVPALLPKAVLMAGVLVLDLWTAARLRTSGRNAIPVEGTLGRLPALLLPALAAAGTGALCLLLWLGHSGALAALGAAGGALLGGLQAFFQLWAAFAQRMSASDAQTSEFSLGTGGGGGLPAEEGSALPPELGALLAGALLAGMLLFVLAALIHWYLNNRNRTRMLGGEELEEPVRPRLGALLAALLRRARLQLFLLQNRDTPRAALIQLERWGSRRRCRRRAAETPREYLERLGSRLEPLLEGAQLADYRQLIADIEVSLYGRGAPALEPERVRALLRAVRRAGRGQAGSPSKSQKTP